MGTTGNAGCLGILMRLFGGRREGPQAPATSSGPALAEAFPYRVRDDFLSQAELSFYRVLLTMLNERAVVCPKVGLADLFFVTRPHENRPAVNRIAQKHVDFLVCVPGTLKPLFGVELNDASHARPDRQARDEYVEQVFAAAGLALVRVPAQRGYSLQDLSARIELLLSGMAVPSAEATAGLPVPSVGTAEASGPPLCPKCGVPMVLRTAGRGERVGQQFYGCPNYPRCRETAPL